MAGGQGTVDANRLCAADLLRYPLSPELHYLRALLLTDLGHPEEAMSAARRVIDLDRTSAAAHFVLGALLQRRGELAGAAAQLRRLAQRAVRR